DGFRQRELQIVNPAYPTVTETAGVVTPVNRYLLSPDLQRAKNTRVSGGVDYALSPRARASVTYRYLRGSAILRGENLNAPIVGARPHRLSGNVMGAASDGSARQHRGRVSAQPPPPPPPPGNAPLWDWKRFGFFSNYTWMSFRNNSDGPFSTPAT